MDLYLFAGFVVIKDAEVLAGTFAADRKSCESNFHLIEPKYKGKPWSDARKQGFIMARVECRGVEHEPYKD